jgi:hypothetical protein
MSDIVSAGSISTERRRSRFTGRALASVNGETAFSLALIDQQAELQVGRVEAVSYVGKRALHEIALTSQLEVQLSALVPAATSRLQAISDMVALGAADIVSHTVRKVSR